MQQLEIQLFFPLTDQTKLDLDFTPCEQWIEDWRNSQVVSTTGNFLPLLIGSGGTGSTISLSQPVTSSFILRPDVKNVGKWEITNSVFVYSPTKPNAVVRFFAKLLFGFKWHDEI